MVNFRRLRLIAVGVVAAGAGMATPAHAFYVVQWINSYGGGLSYVCDNGSVYSETGVVGVGTPYLVYQAPGQPPC